MNPVQRIDWVVGSDTVEFTSTVVLDSTASDHRPVLVDLVTHP